MRTYLLVMVMAAAITYLLVPVALKLALRLGAVSHVRSRDVHTFPIARMGGLAMYCGFALSLLVATQVPYLSKIFTLDSSAWGVMIGAGVMCGVGVIDDIYELPWYAKLAGEVLAAGVMAWFGVQLISLPILGVTIGSARMNLLGTVIVVVLVANAVNFVDGLDGLAAGLVGIGGFAFFAYAYYLTRMIDPGDFTSVACVMMAALVGACVGFLPHNFHQARIFMGDSGALMLGAIVAGAAVVITGQIDPANVKTSSAIPAFMPIFIPALILIIPLVDTFWAVLRRVLRGQSPFHADAGHLHHRLLRRGHSHTKAVLVLYMWAAVISFAGTASVIFPLRTVFACTAVGIVVATIITVYQMNLPRVPRIAQSSVSEPSVPESRAPEDPVSESPVPEAHVSQIRISQVTDNAVPSS
ncbi:MAG: MraY family glycosyltransferase [Actinomycetaceae bacterium]|nr:MraY family glycosyltransferase [Actinomycetaceae bacterium]MDY5854545.1 MraY family glycosyltransferase [Arcanobacterium sp.]